MRVSVPIFKRLRQVLAVARAATRYPVEWDDVWTDEGRVLVLRLHGVPRSADARECTAVRVAVAMHCFHERILMTFVTESTPRRMPPRRRAEPRRQATAR